MRLSYVNIIFVRAGMSELADEADSKSVGGNIVWVQVPLPALKNVDFKGFIHPYDLMSNQTGNQIFFTSMFN